MISESISNSDLRQNGLFNEGGIVRKCRDFRTVSGVGKTRNRVLGQIYSSVLPESSFHGRSRAFWSRNRSPDRKRINRPSLNIVVSVSVDEEDNNGGKNPDDGVSLEECSNKPLDTSTERIGLNKIEITDFDSVIDEGETKDLQEIETTRSGCRAPPITPIITVREYFEAEEVKIKEEDRDSGIVKNEDVPKYLEDVEVSVASSEGVEGSNRKVTRALEVCRPLNTLRKSLSVPTVAGSLFETSNHNTEKVDELKIRQLTALHWAVMNKDKNVLNHLFSHGVDFTRPLRNVTALSLSIYLKHSDMTIELLRLMSASNQIFRGINSSSIDNASRREAPIITASRTGLLEAVAELIKFGADPEVKDGEGKTALWHAVREEQEPVFYFLLKFARVHYSKDDSFSCPLQLACKVALLKKSGLSMAKDLVRHGANVEYADLALRNALYWSMYNCSGEMVIFLLNAGAEMKPWTWIEDCSLPESILNDRYFHWRVRRARSNPRSLRVLSKIAVRNIISKKTRGRSILSSISSLDVSKESKNRLSFVTFELDSTSGDKEARNRIKRLGINLE